MDARKIPCKVEAHFSRGAGSFRVSQQSNRGSGDPNLTGQEHPGDVSGDWRSQIGGTLAASAQKALPSPHGKQNHP